MSSKIILNPKGFLTALFLIIILFSLPHTLVLLFLSILLGIIGILVIASGKHQLKIVTPYKTLIVLIGMLLIGLEAFGATEHWAMKYLILLIVALNIFWAVYKEYKKKHFFNMVLGVITVFLMFYSYEFHLRDGHSLMSVSMTTIIFYSLFIIFFVVREFSRATAITNILETIVAPAALALIYGLEYWAIGRAVSLGIYMSIVALKGRSWTVLFFIDGKKEV